MIRFGFRAIAHQSPVYLRIAGRAWLLVALVSCNTVLLASGRMLPAIIGAWLLNWLWWGNSSRHRADVPGAGFTYGVGGALGTLTGMAIARWCF